MAPPASQPEEPASSSAGLTPAGWPNRWFWKGDKPNFVFAPCGAERIIYLSGRYPEPGLRRGAGSSEVPYLALHPMGFSVPPRLRLERWALTPPFHPYRRTCARRRSEFLWHFPSARLTAWPPACIPTLATGLRSIAPCGVRTFLPRPKPGATLCPSKTGAKLRAAHTDGKRRAEESGDSRLDALGRKRENPKSEARSPKTEGSST